MIEEIRIVAMVDMATGNESVGTEWRETRIFDINDRIIDIFKWLEEDTRKSRYVSLTVADNDLKLYQEICKN